MATYHRGLIKTGSYTGQIMADDNQNILDQIAQDVDTVVQSQEDDNDGKVAQEGNDDFDPQDYERDMEDYDGGW